MLNLLTNKPFALITSEKLSAEQNMLIDREIFDSFKASSTPIFRVYEWKESFTYGFSQKIDIIKDLKHLQKYDTNHAQRITGGGILFHGNDISYSLIIPILLVKNLSVKQSYELICSFLIKFYISLGLNPIYAKDSKNIDISKSEFCQEGFEPYDILVDGKKIGGNAQRRSKDCIFQHGSICIDNSVKVMGNSLEDFGIVLSFEKARDLLIKSFKNTFNIVFEENNKDVAYAS